MLPLQLHDHTRGFLGSTNTKWPWQHSHAHARQHVIHVTPVLASQPPSASSSKLKNWSVCSNASEQLGPKRKQGASTTALDLKTSKRFLGKRKQAMEIHGNLTEHAGKSCWNSEFPKLWKGIQIAGKSFNQICMFPWVVYRWQRLQPNLTGAISSVSLDSRGWPRPAALDHHQPMVEPEGFRSRISTQCLPTCLTENSEMLWWSRILFERLGPTWLRLNVKQWQTGVVKVPCRQS